MCYLRVYVGTGTEEIPEHVSNGWTWIEICQICWDGLRWINICKMCVCLMFSTVNCCILHMAHSGNNFRSWNSGRVANFKISETIHTSNGYRKINRNTSKQLEYHQKINENQHEVGISHFGATCKTTSRQQEVWPWTASSLPPKKGRCENIQTHRQFYCDVEVTSILSTLKALFWALLLLFLCWPGILSDIELPDACRAFWRSLVFFSFSQVKLDQNRVFEACVLKRSSENARFVDFNGIFTWL